MNTKQLLLIIPLILLVLTSKAQESNKEKFEKLEWLTGKWTRTNSKVGQSGYETWAKISDVKLSGKGVTLQGKKAVFIENLEIVAKGLDIFYVVALPDEKEPVYFKFTEISNTGFTCENAAHDFPQKITYKRIGNTIKAVISGNGQSVDYIFVRNQAK